MPLNRCKGKGIFPFYHDARLFHLACFFVAFRFFTLWSFISVYQISPLISPLRSCTLSFFLVLFFWIHSCRSHFYYKYDIILFFSIRKTDYFSICRYYGSGCAQLTLAIFRMHNLYIYIYIYISIKDVLKKIERDWWCWRIFLYFNFQVWKKKKKDFRQVVRDTSLMQRKP